MIMIIRCVNMSVNVVRVEEFFLEFLKVDDVGLWGGYASEKQKF